MHTLNHQLQLCNLISLCTQIFLTEKKNNQKSVTTEISFFHLTSFFANSTTNYVLEESNHIVYESSIICIHYNLRCKCIM